MEVRAPALCGVVTVFAVFVVAHAFERNKFTECKSLEQYEAVLTKLHRVHKQLKSLKEECDNKVKGLQLTTNSFGTYYFHTDKDIKKSWFGAAEFCREFGMDLVSIESAAENNFIVKTINKILDCGTEDQETMYWIGANNLNNYNTWTWTGTGQAAGYFSWRTGEPDYTGSCINIARVDNSFLWGDHDCDNKGRFICELKGPCGTFNATCTATPTKKKNCKKEK